MFRHCWVDVGRHFSACVDTAGLTLGDILVFRHSELTLGDILVCRHCWVDVGRFFSV